MRTGKEIQTAHVRNTMHVAKAYVLPRKIQPASGAYAFFAEGDRTGYEETYHFFAGFVGLMLLAWLFLTIYRGGVA